MTKRIKEVQIDSTEEKEVIWCPENLKEEIRVRWPDSMRMDGGFELGRVQQGLEPSNYKPMSTIGTGVKEIRLQDKNKSQYRIIYIAKFPEAIYVIHVITKKTAEKTSQQDIKIAKTRLQAIIAHRKGKKLK